MVDKIKLILADSEEVFREGIAKLLEDKEHIDIVHRCNNGDEAVQKTKVIKPNVVLIDSEISDCGLIEAVTRIKESSPEVNVVVVTRAYQGKDPFTPIDAGARGILAKNISKDDLVKSLELIASGRIVISPLFSNRFLDEVTSLRRDSRNRGSDMLPVSRRELEIVKLISEGATNREIAETLVIAENTVKAHIKNIVRKLGLRNRQQLAAYAVAKGLSTQPAHSQDVKPQ